MFSLANALPLGAVIYYLKESISTREDELRRLQDLLTLSPSEALGRVESLCRSATSTFLLKTDRIIPIQPHSPESAPIILTNDEVVENINSTIPGTSELFDSITASRDMSRSKPFSFIHFGLPLDSDICTAIKKEKDRGICIVYTGSMLGNDLSVSVKGTVTFVEDERLRKFYWRDRWNSWINKENLVLVKVLPVEVSVTSLNGGETFIDGVRFLCEGDQWIRV